LSIEKPYENLAALFGKVAFLAPPDVYLEQRPILQAPFRPEKMQKYATIMQREIQKWIDSLAPSGEIEITREMGKLVQAVAAHTLMGEDFQKRVGQEFWDLYAVLGKALSIVTPPHWPLPKNIRRDKAKKRMQEILTPIIAERRRYPEANDDFLQEFVNTKCRSGADADDETIVSLIRALMFASHETTAGQSAWTLIELLRHPEYLSKVHEEISARFPNGAALDGGMMRGMAHIHWAVREIERVHPSADILLRLAEKEIRGRGLPCAGRMARHGEPRCRSQVAVRIHAAGRFRSHEVLTWSGRGSRPSLRPHRVRRRKAQMRGHELREQ